jgi:DNA-binding HxlR family transcriptional regulator
VWFKNIYRPSVRRRSYEQFCSLATALDVVGERWTLLVIRELMLGPRRFTDLLDGLPGVGRNLLAARLRHLEAEGLVRHTDVYELTEDGRRLGPALAELGRWGVERLGVRREQQTFRPAWGMFPLSYMADREAARGVHETWEFRIDEATFTLRVDDGRVLPRSGPAEGDPDLVVRMDTDTLADLFSGTLPALEALTSGRVVAEGTPEALQHAVAILAGPG